MSKAKEELNSVLVVATTDALLVMVAAIVAESEYIENATDGCRMQYTIEYITSRGKKSAQSSHLVNVALKAYHSHMTEPLNPSPRNESVQQ